MAKLNIRETKREENEHKGKNQVHTVVPSLLLIKAQTRQEN
jgi:hypothetical protein